MDARAMRKHAASASPDLTAKLYTGKKIPVVYYLCRNRHLEHPHFIEVPISSSEGLFLRDVIGRLNVLRGRGMAAMYSWSCKRSYKNGFVWHDLSEDDLILPAHGNEYVLKGSELLDRSASDRNHGAKLESSKHGKEDASPSRIRELSSSSSSPPIVVIREAKPASPLLPLPRSTQEDRLSGSSGSPSPVEIRACKPNVAQDAATQTDKRNERMEHRKKTCVRGVSTDDASLDFDSDECCQNRLLKPKQSSEIEREDISPVPASLSSSMGKMETLESLIRAEAKMNSFRFLEEDQVLVSARTRLKAANLLMHLISCGSMSVKDNQNFGLVPNYGRRFSHTRIPPPMYQSSMFLGELDCLSDNPSLIRSRMEDKEYFSGSLIETKKHMVEAGDGVPTLKRSSSYNEERHCKVPVSKKERERVVESGSKCFPRTIKTASSKQSRKETMRSPISDMPRKSSALLDASKQSPICSSKGGSKRITDSSSLKGSSTRFDSFREDKEKMIKIEESFLQELGL